MRFTSLTLGIIVSLSCVACQSSSDAPQSTNKANQAITKTPPKTPTKPAEAPKTDVPKTPKADTNRWVLTVQKRNNTLWTLGGKAKRLCLPSGLYQQLGLKLSVDASTIVPIKPNERRACQRFDTSTIKFVTTPTKLNTYQVTPTALKGGKSVTLWGLTYKHRVAVGPSAMGLKTETVCAPTSFSIEQTQHYNITGYPHPQPTIKAKCTQWVFTKIEAIKKK